MKVSEKQLSQAATKTHILRFLNISQVQEIISFSKLHVDRGKCLALVNDNVICIDPNAKSVGQVVPFLKQLHNVTHCGCRLFGG